MGDVTVSTLVEGLILLASIITSCGVIYSKIKKWLGLLLDEHLEKIETNQKNNMEKIEGEMADLKKQIKISDMESCKNFLVRCLADVERGQIMSETEKQRFYEQYEHYTSPENKGNSYIMHKTEELQKAGKL